MNKIRTVLLLSAACASTPGLALAAAPASEMGFWTGPYAGGQVGLNDASADGLSSENAFTVSPHLGYNVAVPLRNTYSPLVLGADVFAEFNGKATHSPGPGHNPRFGSDVYGVDALAGMPLGRERQIMPYVKIGFGTLNGTGDLGGSDTSLRAGLGAEYRLYPNFGLTGEWMHQDADHITNNNFTVGVNYHFRGY